MATNNAVNSGLSGTTGSGNFVGSASPTLTGTPIIPTPFTLGATSVTTTGTQLNYLAGLSVIPINKINVQSITSTGAFTYTKTTGTVFAIFEIQGAGAGSGGTTGASSQGAVSGGGGGGAYQKILVNTANLAGAITGSVGAAGTAGSSGNNSGGNGGDTTLVVNGGSTWTAAGGLGGPGQASSGSAQVSSNQSGGTNTSGTNATLIFAIAGGNNRPGFVSALAASPYIPSDGGTGFLSNDSQSNNGLNYGNGGSGLVNVSGANMAGKTGAQGIVIVTEFISA